MGAEKENINAQGKGKDKVVDLPPPPPQEEEEEDDNAGDDSQGEAEESDSDMQLAWQMLEVARTIYVKDAEQYAAELAGTLLFQARLLQNPLALALSHLAVWGL
jgi:hypothetical protein